MAVPKDTYRENWRKFSVKCSKCNTVVTTRWRYDWARCKCCAFYVYGNNPPQIAGTDTSAVLTLDGEQFFERCRADIFCANLAWHGKGRCREHINCDEDDEFFSPE